MERVWLTPSWGSPQEDFPEAGGFTASIWEEEEGLDGGSGGVQQGGGGRRKRVRRLSPAGIAV